MTVRQYQDLRLELGDGIATITLARPERMNALGKAMFASIHQALDLAEEEGARCLLLTGEGRAFCSGADLADESVTRRTDLGDVIDEYYNPLARRLAGLDIPVVSAVNGPAVGAGAGLALSGDIVVMARSAYFQLAFVNIGLVPDGGTSWLVNHAVGRMRALEMALMGERVGAEQALEWGLVTRVVDDPHCLTSARELAVRLANGPTKAMGMMRRQIRAASGSSFDASLALERDNQREAGRTADFREGVAAFLEKRAADFTGR